MKKRNTEKLLNWDAHYVGIKATKERQQNCITLDELVKEVMPLLSPYAPIITEEAVAFTFWVESALKGSILLQKKNSWYRPRTY
jgi:valyl-tRNA synthetase